MEDLATPGDITAALKHSVGVWGVGKETSACITVICYRCAPTDNSSPQAQLANTVCLQTQHHCHSW